MRHAAWLAFAADLYIPLLAVIYMKRLLGKARTSPAALFGMLLVNLGMAWGLMFADRMWDIWPAWQLDYSTHTAVSLALIVGLCFSAPRQIPIWALSFALYAALMMALGYHSVADIVSTVAVDLPLMLVAGVGCNRLFAWPASS